MEKNIRIEEIDKQIKELEKSKKILEEEKEKILKEEKEEELSNNWKEIQNQVINISTKDCVCVSLARGTRTVPIFDSFMKSKKDYLLLESVFYYSYLTKTFFGMGPKYTGISFIIKKIKKRIRVIGNDDITISVIKENIDKDIDIIKHNEFRLKKLAVEILNCFQNDFNNKILKNESLQETFYSFSKPILLGAQTSKNREGYGNIYNGEELIREGTKYGDTTKFLIVGVGVGSKYDKTIF